MNDSIRTVAQHINQGLPASPAQPDNADDSYGLSGSRTDAATVFIVDDNEALREVTKRCLIYDGLAVRDFACATELLDENLNRHGCLVLDVRMPGMSGLALQRVLKQRGIDMPVIFVSGLSDVAIAVAAMRNGAFEFLEKPYQPQVLIARVRQALELDRRRRDANDSVQLVQQRLARLSRREWEVLVQLVSGLANTSNRTIADELGISIRTVDTYRSRIMTKMRARSFAELVEFARLGGLRSECTRPENFSCRLQ